MTRKYRALWYEQSSTATTRGCPLETSVGSATLAADVSVDKAASVVRVLAGAVPEASLLTPVTIRSIPAPPMA